MSGDNLRHPSLCLARLLDHIIGTEHQVSMSRKLMLLKNYCMSLDKTLSSVTSGSRAEGYNLRSSDSDYMQIYHDVEVLESETNITNLTTDKTTLLMSREGCQPGYVILQLLKLVHSCCIGKDELVEWNNCVVLSSTLMRNKNTLPTVHSEPHGPCNMVMFYKREVDYAIALECKQWPTEANAFFQRSKPHRWPSQTLQSLIRRTGCHLVAVGDKTSNSDIIQWRISFAAAERILVQSFNHTQLRVYVLMKIFHKQLIETYDEVKDLLCSYFIKTVMFHMIENTTPLIWREDNFITLFWRCFMKLIQWVEDGYCPNYFIPENNLFKSKIYGTNQDNLLKVFHKIKREGWKTVYKCVDIRHAQKDSFNSTLLNLRADLKENEVHNDYRLFGLLFGFNTFNHSRKSPFPVELALRKVRKVLDISKSRSDTEMYVVISRLLLGSIGQCVFLDAWNHNQCRMTGNKTTYRNMKASERLLMTGAKVDISRGALNLALFYYAINRYDKVIQICEKVISNMTPYTLHIVSQGYPKLDNYKKYICGRGIGIAEKMKQAVALDLIVRPYCRNLYPKELLHDIDALVFNTGFYPPLPFATFLKFLCYHKQGAIDKSISAIHDLKDMIQDKDQGIYKYYFVNNLIAVCLDKLGATMWAVEACLRSQHLQPDFNGVSQLLKEILSRT